MNDRLLVFVNHEAYFLSSPATKMRFERRPWKYCGLVTDPVTLDRFRPTKKSPSCIYNGRPYYFATDETKVTFLDDPETYRAARNRMVPESESESEIAEKTEG